MRMQKRYRNAGMRKSGVSEAAATVVLVMCPSTIEPLERRGKGLAMSTVACRPIAETTHAVLLAALAPPGVPDCVQRLARFLEQGRGAHCERLALYVLGIGHEF